MINASYTMQCDSCGEQLVHRDCGLLVDCAYEQSLIKAAEREGWIFDGGHHYCHLCKVQPEAEKRATEVPLALGI